MACSMGTQPIIKTQGNTGLDVGRPHTVEVCSLSSLFLKWSARRKHLSYTGLLWKLVLCGRVATLTKGRVIGLRVLPGKKTMNKYKADFVQHRHL